MTRREIVYFESAGERNTDATIAAARARVEELGLRHVVVASTTGVTALKAARAFAGRGVSVVCVGEHCGFWGGDSQKFDPKIRAELESMGVPVLICTHALSGVERSIANKFGGTSRVEVVSNTLRLFGSDGLKVAVEVSVMAADAGLVPTDAEILAIGGTHHGCDTAVVLKSAHMNSFFDLEIREIVAVPRRRAGG